MSDTAWASISIGGKIHPDVFKTLLDMCYDEGFIIDPSEDLTKYMTDEGLLKFESDDALGAQYSILEQWLKDHSIPFIRDSDPYAGKHGDIPPQSAYWLPGMEDTHFIINDPDQLHLIHVGEIQSIILATKLIDSIEKAPTNINHKDFHIKGYAHFILETNSLDPMQYLHKYLKEKFSVPDLPKLDVS